MIREVPKMIEKVLVMSDVKCSLKKFKLCYLHNLAQEGWLKKKNQKSFLHHESDFNWLTRRYSFRSRWILKGGVEAHICGLLGVWVPLLEKDDLGFGHVREIIPSMIVAVSLIQDKLFDREFHIHLWFMTMVIRFNVVLKLQSHRLSTGGTPEL